MDNENGVKREQTEKETDAESYGCSHYRRKCAFITPCCQKTYTCRVCHDEQENHEVDRHAVKTVQCLKCGKQQDASNICIKCEVVFGAYHCAICNLYDDIDRKQFHCVPCGICRVGGRDKYVHCEKCDTCMAKNVQHKCVEKVSRSPCPVCLEDMHSSRLGCQPVPCGHFLHRSCFEELMKKGHYKCPMCCRAMINMTQFWKDLDEEIAVTEMPAEYANIKRAILCEDCLKYSKVKFHVLGLKCQHCGSYNTCDAGPDEYDKSDGEESSSSDDATPDPSNTSAGSDDVLSSSSNALDSSGAQASNTDTASSTTNESGAQDDTGDATSQAVDHPQ